MKPNTLLIDDARDFAIAAHEEKAQERKYTGMPYWTHCGEVAMLVEAVGGSDVQIAAAWLHDVLEDTDVTFEVLQQTFGPVVAEMVGWLTDVSKPEHGNRATRKEMDRVHTAMAPKEAKTVKLADLISNATSILRYDPDFAKVYLKEKARLLPHLQSGNGQLWNMASEILVRAQEF